jgi:hypothetical protein
MLIVAATAGYLWDDDADDDDADDARRAPRSPLQLCSV